MDKRRSLKKDSPKKNSIKKNSIKKNSLIKNNHDSKRTSPKKRTSLKKRISIRRNNYSPSKRLSRKIEKRGSASLEAVKSMVRNVEELNISLSGFLYPAIVFLGTRIYGKIVESRRKADELRKNKEKVEGLAKNIKDNIKIILKHITKNIVWGNYYIMTTNAKKKQKEGDEIPIYASNYTMKDYNNLLSMCYGDIRGENFKKHKGKIISEFNKMRNEFVNGSSGFPVSPFTEIEESPLLEAEDSSVKDEKPSNAIETEKEIIFYMRDIETTINRSIDSINEYRKIYREITEEDFKDYDDIGISENFFFILTNDKKEFLELLITISDTGQKTGQKTGQRKGSAVNRPQQLQQSPITSGGSQSKRPQWSQSRRSFKDVMSDSALKFEKWTDSRMKSDSRTKSDTNRLPP